MTVLHTERLTLRPLVTADAEPYAALRFHPEVARWLPPAAAGVAPLDAVRATIERFERAWTERRYAPWGIFHDGRLIGHGGLNWVPEFGETEVLWALHPDAWGQGFATETARAALDYGFDTLGLERIFAITMPDNRASQAVMTRLGMTYRKNVTYKGFEAVWFEIDRERCLGLG
jgi:[ribosomal protein S5]-alanine N-acetyltransferase